MLPVGTLALAEIGHALSGMNRYDEAMEAYRLDAHIPGPVKDRRRHGLHAQSSHDRLLAMGRHHGHQPGTRPHGRASC